MVPILTAERAAVGLTGLLVLLAIEAWRPFKPSVDSRLRRYAINFTIMGANALLLSVLLGGWLLSAYRSLELHGVGLLHVLGVSGWPNVLASVIALDGITFAWHYAYHRVPLMWRMHQVHHSDLDLDVTSAGRFHLTEMVFSALFRLGMIAAIGADLASVVIFELVFGLFNQLEHANIRLPGRLDPILRLVVVTPDMHRVHHSQVSEETNSNFGTIFSWWDRLAGTYCECRDQRALRIGLPEYPSTRDVSLWRVLAMPLRPAAGPSRPAGLRAGA